MSDDASTTAAHARRDGAGTSDDAQARSGSARLLWSLLMLARPSQWAKSLFVVIGPLYFIAEGNKPDMTLAIAVLATAAAFAMASSFCYVINDLRDREADRLHPRKRQRPLASGAVTPRQALVFGTVLLIAGAMLLFLVPGGMAGAPGGALGGARGLVLLTIGVYVVNVTVYSLGIKRVVILDVISLAGGFVLRALAGCAAISVEPSSWLLNSTFFLAMFLAFGKRLGERRTMGQGAAAVRDVQASYTDDFLRMAVVVTAVTTLLSYAGYVQAHEDAYTRGFNLLWLTVLPATYGLLRCIVLLEHGRYDDPTTLATHDRPFQLSVAVFAVITVVLVGLREAPPPL